MPIIKKREKVFGHGRGVPLDRNAKVRIETYARAWTANHKQPRQHRGPITARFMEVLKALLWEFHNSRSGLCFPSYERIAEKVKEKFGSCARSEVAEAIKVLEWAGILTWVHRLARIRVLGEKDLFGRPTVRWQVIRTSNSYVFIDPLARAGGRPACKSENPPGTPNQDSKQTLAPKPSYQERAIEQHTAAGSHALADREWLERHNEQRLRAIFGMT